VKAKRGFTLIEMMVVVSIIAIVALMAMPKPDPTITKRQVTESVELIDDYQKLVEFFYKSTTTFLKNNQEANIPAPDKLLGNYIERIDLQDGAFHLYFGNKAHPELKGKILSIQPLVVTDSPESPISWNCGKAKAPPGMQTVGENRTDIDIKNLPLNCRI
jgi:type IV pilus assembly protein PilA